MGTLDRLTGEIAERAKQTVRETHALARNARRSARRKRASVALVERLERELEAAEQILAQTDLRLAGSARSPAFLETGRWPTTNNRRGDYPKEEMMRRTVALFLVGSVCALALTAFALAASEKTVWTAALSSGQEVPKQTVKNAAAHGLFKGTLSGSTLTWKLTFAKLTGPATAAHIHMAAKGKSGAVVIPLCGPCKSGVTGKATVSKALMAAFKKHLLYVNVHTAKNPNGEIRGQLAVG